MQTMDHAIVMARPKGMTPQRATGLIFAGLLQVVLIFALVEGLNIKVWPTPENKMEGRIIPDKNAVKPPEAPPLPPVYNPIPIDPIAPTIPIDDGDSTTRITTVRGPVTPPTTYDRMAAAVGGTHTTPPYPPLAIRLSEEGSVQLRLTISAQGSVTDAVVVRSSGYDDLDQAARNWILAHWRYQPAARGGAAVASTSDVQVRFDLKNAH